MQCWNLDSLGKYFWLNADFKMDNVLWAQLMGSQEHFWDGITEAQSFRSPFLRLSQLPEFLVIGDPRPRRQVDGRPVLKSRAQRSVTWGGGALSSEQVWPLRPPHPLLHLSTSCCFVMRYLFCFSRPEPGNWDSPVTLAFISWH